MSRVPTDEIIFEPASMVDGAGKVFWWKGEVFRAIRAGKDKFYRDLLSSEQLDCLFEAGLVPAEVTEHTLDDYPLVMRHKRIPHVSYCMEWSSEMLKDAAMMICNLSRKLLGMGLTIKDAHPWNVLFHAGRPFFVDWGSIVPATGSTNWPYTEFRAWFLCPLYLMSAGRNDLAHTLLSETINPPLYADIIRLLFMRIPLIHELHFILSDRKARIKTNILDQEFFYELDKMVQSITIGTKKTEWTDYEGPDKYPLSPCNEWPARINTIYTLLQKTNPGTLLDIGCNRGWYSKLAIQQGIDVIAVDIDESSINSLYDYTKQTNCSILPLIMDFCRPTPAHGLANSYQGAIMRLRAEMVLALAVTHHLVFKRNLSFEAIAKQLSEFTGKWLIVEFVPADDIHVSNWIGDQHAWYTIENFIKALKKYYHQIEISESSPSPRKLLFCTK